MSDSNNISSTLPPAGWYPDPHGGSAQRYWDGAQWAAADATPASIAAADTVRRLPKLKWWHWTLIVIGVLVVVSIIIGGINGGRDSARSAAGTTPSGAASAAPTKEAVEEVKTVVVPDMVGSTVAEARGMLDAVGLSLTASDAGDDWVVTAQQPGAGSHPAEGLELSITSEAPKPVYTLEQENALGAARSYLDLTGFSRQGLIDQLSSEYGSGFPIDVATWAADAVGADWNAEAVESAQSYLDMTSFSRQGLYDQLTSQYGGQFTPDEANQALTAVGY
ncbi:Ltp family lipoprotein [Microbacterium memoriense]|uniref:Ltp family lipoprotein n=1 Tax=Microbacterium memoriense TaxID=2978350 RepID=A0ABT2PA77_9MICO|nr:Ltp family lipoprotein [Microbacterium memoriense]MCT9001072.1 Ltp family lipoprotein [Microbacterium memoriense]